MAVLAAALLLAPWPRAQAGECRLALVLALDASASVNPRDYRLQSHGLAEALLDADVRAAIVQTGGILATAYEWSGRQQQVTIADWTMLADEATILRFAARLTGHRRAYIEFPTAIGYAFGIGAVRLARAPVACARRVIDMSGDGVHNEGFPPEAAYRAFDFAGITVNGLVIKGEDPDPESYYRDRVLFGPGAFLEIARNYQDYARAMKRKLLREIGGVMVSSAGR